MKNIQKHSQYKTTKNIKSLIIIHIHLLIHIQNSQQHLIQLIKRKCRQLFQVHFILLYLFRRLGDITQIIAFGPFLNGALNLLALGPNPLQRHIHRHFAPSHLPELLHSLLTLPIPIFFPNLLNQRPYLRRLSLLSLINF